MRVLALALLVLTACPPHPVPPPSPPDASDAGLSCADACANLAALGCADGTRPECLTVLTNEDRAATIPTPCGSHVCPPVTCAALAAARTIAEARSRGAACR
jgi:hypothetical protein